MGKAADRRRQAKKRGEKPNSTVDRVKHQIRLNDDNLYNMYIWHETKMNELRDKHNDELLAFLEKQSEKAEKAKKNEIKSIRMCYELKIQRLTEKQKSSVENDRIVEQARDFIQMIMVSQLCEAKRNSFYFNKAKSMGLLDTSELKKVNDMLKSDKIEDKLMNPIFEMSKKSSK